MNWQVASVARLALGDIGDVPEGWEPFAVDSGLIWVRRPKPEPEPVAPARPLRRRLVKAEAAA